MASVTKARCPAENPIIIIKENDMNFGEAIEHMRQGHRMMRRGWNGKGIFVAMQKPDTLSFMTQPYIYIDTTELQTTNPDAPKGRVPWLASQTDLLATDWTFYD
jgi:hypothetical protein